MHTTTKYFLSNDMLIVVKQNQKAHDPCPSGPEVISLIRNLTTTATYERASWRKQTTMDLKK